MDKLTPQQRSKNMRRIGSKGMKPELAVRRLVHSLGYRYRLQGKALPGKPDLVFHSRRKVNFVHGCFWHQHNDPACKSSHKPKSNADYWNPKLRANVARDLDHVRQLEELRWDVLILWECELSDETATTVRLVRFLFSIGKV